MKYPGTKNYEVEPSNNQCRNQYQELQKWIQDAPFVDKFNNSMNEIYFKNGSVIKFFSAELRERTRGYTCTGITIIDETAFTSNDVIDNILPWLDVHKCPLLCISTPMFLDDSYFAQWYQNADNKTSFRFDWASGEYDMSAFLSNEKLEFYRKQVSEFKFLTEYLGQFATEGGYVFKNILNCIKKPSNNNPVSAGIDFGTGTGNDWTVITLFNEQKEMVDIQMVNDMSPVEQIEWLANIINSYPSLKSVYAEKNSIGNVYISTLRQKLHRKNILHEFNTTNQSKKDIVESFVAALANNEVSILDNNELIKQLQHYTVQKLSNGNYTYNNDNPTIHDDAVMATCIAWYALTGKSGTYSMSMLRNH